MIFSKFGLILHGKLPKRLNWEVQLFAPIREFKDGLTFFEMKINWDRYEDDHSPAFQIELTIFNLYNHIWIYQNNYDN